MIVGLQNITHCLSQKNVFTLFYLAKFTMCKIYCIYLSVMKTSAGKAFLTYIKGVTDRIGRLLRKHDVMI